MRELADEADRVDDHRLSRHLGGDLLRFGIERGEELIDGHGVAAREAVEHRRLAGVRVADQSDGERGAAQLALRVAMLLNFLQIFLEAGDARADDAAVELELRLTDAAPRAAAGAARA